MNEFLKFLRKNIANSRGKKAIDSCEKILGTNGKVQEFGIFYEQHEEDLLVFVSAKMMEWVTKQSFTQEQLDFYKLGLTEVITFMMQCKQETDRKNAEAIEQIQQKLAAQQTVIS